MGLPVVGGHSVSVLVLVRAMMFIIRRRIIFWSWQIITFV